MTAYDERVTSGATEPLDQLEEIAREAGVTAVADEARALSERIAAGRFYVACVGQFKRGKSTLINALVGQPVLPTGVIPVTAIPTVVRYGDAGARVRLREDGWQAIPLGDIAEYVTEARNPENAKGVLGAELLVRAPLLRPGLCLVDTPGIGSVFEANNAAARAFVPQIDAAIVVIGADPPISGEELALVSTVAESVQDLVFVLNKMDRLPPAERQEALGFTERVIRERLGSPVDHVFEVSALAALRGEGDAGAWAELVAALEQLPARRDRLVSGAMQRGVARLGTRLERALHHQRSALTRPLEDTQRQIAELRGIASGTERFLGELGPLLEAEQKRLRRRFEARRVQFVDDTLPEARTELARRLDASSFGGRIGRAVAIEIANAVARECVRPWLTASERDAEAAYRDATRRFSEYGVQALAKLGQAGDLDPATLRLDAEPTDGFRARRGFYFHDLLYRHDPPRPWRPLVDRLLPPRVSRRRVAEAAERYLEDLVHINASRVEGDLNERVQESRRHLEAEMAGMLAELVEAAERALERARQARSAGEAAVHAAVAATDQRLEAISKILTPAAGRTPEEVTHAML
jgi:GTP-binding protein EngB required for normal cell division